MDYGLIGERLPHSFSREIHGKIADYDYQLCEISRDKLEDFMTAHKFKAINVTIPYKEAVIPYLSELDETAKLCGAVNTVVNRDGRLVGYNTDICGMGALVRRLGIELKGKTVLILGTGGTSKTAAALASMSGALNVVRVSRTGRDGSVTYDEAYSRMEDSDIIINTTPCGMYPDVDGVPILQDRFKSLTGVVDAVYNPLRTNLVLDAAERGIASEGGLFMLVAQAVAASELFTGEVYNKSVTDRVFRDISAEKENIVLIGMPGAGKSTVGQIIAERLGRRLIDTDEQIVKSAGMAIPEIFDRYGEERFRELESKVIAEVSSANTGSVISTGGGAVLLSENVRSLRRSGRLFYLDRPLLLLRPTDDRPLARDFDALRRRYEERHSIYSSVCDAVIDNSGTLDSAADAVIDSLRMMTDI